MKAAILVLAAKVLVAAHLLAAIVPAYHYAERSFLRENDPPAAYRSHPGDARALAQVIGARLAADPAYAPDAATLDNLRRALVSRPLSPDLLAAYGLARQAGAMPAEALAAMRLANQVSRRGSLASLWLVEAASSAGDVPGAVRHYNNALSVHPALGEALLPVLARGIAFPEVRRALASYLARPANWTGQFLQVAASESSPADLGALLTPLPARLRDERYRQVMGLVLQRLAAEGEPGAAASLASGLIPGIDPRVLSALAPSAQTLDPRLGPLAWQFPDDGGITIEAGAGGVFELTVQPLATGLAAYRDVLLEGGRTYALTQRVTYGSEGGDVGLTWRASCKAGGEAIGFWEMRLNSAPAGTLGPQLLEVPAQCAAATIALEVEGPDAQSPVTVRLSQLALKVAGS